MTPELDCTRAQIATFDRIGHTRALTFRESRDLEYLIRREAKLILVDAKLMQQALDAEFAAARKVAG